MQNINRVINQTAVHESLSRNEPIRNPHAKGKDTTGMVPVSLKDTHNTVIFCETKEEAERVKPIYDKKMNEFGSGKDKEASFRTAFKTGKRNTK